MKRSRQVLALAGLLVSGALVFGGCGGGGSKRLSKGQFASKANALCAAYTKKIDVLPEPKNAAEGASMVAREIPLFEQLVSDVKKLNPPADEAAKVRRVIALGADDLQLLRDYEKALKAGDSAKASSLQRQGDSNRAESSRLFHELGITACESH
ncbi:MAG: hypothetical protein ABSC51_08595 [Gaiellaceae bacterium]